MNGRILWTALLAAFAGVAGAGEIELNSQTFGGKDRILEDGNTYVVRGNVSFEGGNGTGKSGLTVANGAHVRIRIEKGVTLTCIGGSGASAGSGADGVPPNFKEESIRAYDVDAWDFSYRMPQFSPAEKVGGGAGGGGGGAGIEVPPDSSLTICGEGTLKASGGAGGTGNSGGNGAFGRYRALTIHTSQRSGYDKELGSNDYSQTNRLNWTEDYSKPSGTTSTPMCYSDRDAQPASGGAGGGGAGGGGAGLGSRGANGGSGGDGGAVTNIWHNGKPQSTSTAAPPMDTDECVKRECGGAASSDVSPASCGRIVLEGGVSVDARGGDGGRNKPWEQKLNPSTVVQFVDWRCGDDGIFVKDLQANIYFTEGQHGGSGGRGGDGAAYGTGGGGGGGGAGGDSGSVSGDNHASEMPASNFGDEGGTGADGQSIVPIIPVGFLVNGEDVVLGTGPGWAYDGSVLSLTNAMTYVLSGAATNDKVQVWAKASGATAVLSNAVVFASGRPAVNVAPDATLTVAANQLVRTGETPDALKYTTVYNNESCVLAGPAVTVTVKDIPYVTGFTVSNEVQRIDGMAVTGGTAYRVLVGDDVYVSYTVEEGYTSQSDNPLVYLKIEGDKTVDENAISIVPQPIPYRAWNETTGQMENKECTDYVVVSNATTSFEDGKWYVVRKPVSCGTITVNGSAHLILCDGATLTANGPADNAGLAVGAGNAFAIYGQTLGSGALVANGGANCAGIGSTNRQDCGAVTIHGGTVRAKGGRCGAGIGAGGGGYGGTVTIHGGDLEAVGNNGIPKNGSGAGIGGSMAGDGGVVTITGGRVKAVGGAASAGIGGGTAGDGGQVTISGGYVYAAGVTASGIGGGMIGNGGQVKITGGTVKAEGFWGFPDIGGHEEHGTLTIDGGSVLADLPEGLRAKNSAGRRLHCVTAKCEGLVGLVGLEGLAGYGTNDIYPIGGRVYLWLSNGTHRFTLSDGTTTCRYCAVVKGMGITVEPLGPIGFFVNGEDIGDTGSGTGWNYNKNMKNLTLSEVGLYVLSGVAMNDEVHIHVAGEKAAGATVILSNAVVFVSGQPPALNVDQNISLLMAGGSSFLGATNNIMALSVGPKAALTVGLAPGADEVEAMIGVFNYGDVAAIGGAGSVTVRGGTLAVWADKRAAETPINRTADVLCMLAGDDPETAKVVDTYNGEPYVLVTAAIAPVTPGKPVGPFTTAGMASNAMAKAVLAPRDDVAEKLGAGSSALGTYCDMFGFAVTGGGEAWFVEAELYPEAWSNVMESAQAATRQIPVADIAALPLNTPTNVTAKGCGMPGFYYSFYSGGTVTDLGAVAAEKGRNVLCGTDRDVEFSGVVKPSDAAGFFTIGVKEAPSVTPSDRAELEPPAITDVKTAGD